MLLNLKLFWLVHLCECTHCWREKEQYFDSILHNLEKKIYLSCERFPKDMSERPLCRYTVWRILYFHDWSTCRLFCIHHLWVKQSSCQVVSTAECVPLSHMSAIYWLLTGSLCLDSVNVRTWIIHYSTLPNWPQVCKDLSAPVSICVCLLRMHSLLHTFMNIHTCVV